MAVEPPIFSGRTFVYQGLMQTNLDADNFQIVNLDTSNLVLDPIGAQSAPPHQWYNSYDPGPHLFGSTQPTFPDLGGNLTQPQQLAITSLGTISTGVWNGSVITGTYLTTLDLIRPPVGNVNLSSKRITNLADAVDQQDAINLRSLNQIAQQNIKGAVRAATTGAITLVGTQTVDGVALNSADRVLVRQQAFPGTDNGIYTCATGFGGVWLRATDADSSTELNDASCFVLEGTTNAGSTWLQTTPNPVIGTSPIIFVLIEQTSDITAGDGLQKIGNVISAVGTTNRISINGGIDIDAAYVGQASITTLGTIGTGVWHGSVIPGQYGGTGANNSGFTLSVVGNFSTTLGLSAPSGSTLNFILTNSTSVTLPVTGTLATLGGVETFTNKHISGDQINSGTVAIVNGGTGQSTASTGLTALLPTQNPGTIGLSLKSNGTTAFWG